MTELSTSEEVTFIVGTGRCGSTVLSRVLSEHPEVLSLSELIGVMFFTSNNINLVPDMDGQEVWHVMSSPDPFMDSAVRDGLQMPEMMYTHGSGRFSPATGIPRICQTVLPTLTDDPDALYDRLASEVATWPRRAPGDHCHALFGFLARTMGCRIVVERTGGSLLYAQMLRQEFPRARFVHMYRDGPDCALSMSRHPTYRYLALFRAAATEAGLPWPSPVDDIMASLPEHFTGLLTSPFDPWRFMAYPLPLTWFGEYWSQSTTAGITALRELPGDSWTSVKYENLLADPEAELIRLAEFVGVPSTPEWLAIVQRRIHRRRAGTARAFLDPDTFSALEQACAPGIEAIGTN